jgi:hypothetical protein
MLSRFFGKTDTAEKSGNLPECYCGANLINAKKSSMSFGIHSILNRLLSKVDEIVLVGRILATEPYGDYGDRAKILKPVQVRYF